MGLGWLRVGLQVWGLAVGSRVGVCCSGFGVWMDLNGVSVIGIFRETKKVEEEQAEMKKMRKKEGQSLQAVSHFSSLCSLQ